MRWIKAGYNIFTSEIKIITVVYYRMMMINILYIQNLYETKHMKQEIDK